MALTRVLSLSELPPGSVTDIRIAGTHIAVCNTGGEIRAIGGICPHQSAPLGYGAMNGENVVCPWHAWEFDSRTGCHDYNPDLRVATYPVRIEGDDILVDLDA